jgi:hypothetical protein
MNLDLGVLGKVHIGYKVEKKYFLFGWSAATTQIFDSVQDAEDCLNNFILKHEIIVRTY